ncbi:hypothetical protein T439DRAFT_322141 [Meredithblackwellia eburnea MCA 4105]
MILETLTTASPPNRNPFFDNEKGSLSNDIVLTAGPRENKDVQRKQRQQVQASGSSDGSDATTPEGSSSRGIGPVGNRDGETRIYVPAGYQPEFRVRHNGQLVCHDPLLSVSPESLMSFLETQASTPPVPRINIVGNHQETRTETHTSTDSKGNVTTRTETRQVTVEDFSASYLLTKEVEAGLGLAIEVARAVPYPIGDWDLAFRGSSKKEKGGGGGGDKPEVTSAERRQLEADFKLRKKRGLPLFVHPQSLIDVSHDVEMYGPQTPASFPPGYFPGRLFQGHFLDLVEDHSVAPFTLSDVWSRYQPLVDLRNSRRSEIEKMLRDYCSSKKSMKELHVKKETYGWDWIRIEQELTAIIRSTGFQHNIQISIDAPSKADIMIRPDSFFGRVFSMRWWWKALLWLVLVYPIFLIIDYFAGAKFKSIRVAFPLVRWRTLPRPYPGAPAPQTYQEAMDRAAPLGGGYRFPKVAQLPTDGTWVYLVGLEESDWINSVQERLRQIVVSRHKGVDLG